MNTKLLKQKILDLAIRGKLTQQLKSDGTAADLLKEIADAKSTLSQPKGKKSKNPEQIIPLDKNEAPFEIPANWEWVRLGDLCELQSGFTIPQDQEVEYGRMMYIKVSDMNLPENFYEIKKSQRYVNQWKESQVIKANSIIFPKRGGALLTNKKRIVKESILADLNIMGITPKACFDYIYWWFKNIDLGTLNNGSNIPQVNNKDISPLPIPLPPLAEQQRIVAKIEEAFAEIEAIEKNKELLKTHIKQTRQKILDLAIHGKLVPQNKSDEPASVLLERITRDNPHYEKLTDVPFEIPDSWEWVKLGDVCAYGECDNIEVKNIPETSWILELEDIEKDSGKILQYLTKTERNINGVRHSFKKGDVLYSKLRTYLNKVLVATEDGFCTTEIMPIKVGDLSGEYICQALRSQYFLDYTIMCGYGVKMPRLSTTDAKNGLIPLPPLAEQKRIVDRIEEIFKSLDEISLHLV